MTGERDERCPYRKQRCNTVERADRCPVKALELWTSLAVKLEAGRCQYAGGELEAKDYRGAYGVRQRRKPDGVL